MEKKLFPRLAQQVAMIAALILAVILGVPLSAQIRVSNLSPAIAAASNSSELPKGVNIVAALPLQGQIATRMYTQDEYGHTYLYIEHGPQSLTVIDVTKKREPQIVDHQPGSIKPARYDQLWEGGSIQVSPLFTVSIGFDNQGVRGTLSNLEINNPEDAKLLSAFGQNYANLVDQDRRLVFFASAQYLFVVQDCRLAPTEFISD